MGTSAAKAKRPVSIREPVLLGSFQPFFQDRLGFLSHLARQGDVVSFHIGLVPFVLVNRADYAHDILVDHAQDFPKGRILRRAVRNNGLFVSEGQFHRHQRKLMASCFQPRQFSEYASTMVNYTENLAREWTDESVVDVDRDMMRLTMRIVGKVLFDTDFLSESDDLGAAISTGLAHAVRVISSPFTLPLTIPTAYNRRVLQAQRLVEARLRLMIGERRQSTAPGHDLLSLLLDARDDAGEPMSEQQLIDECLTLFTAGHETTAAALTWTWYLLCLDPERYLKLQDEVSAVLRGRSPEPADLPKLP